MQDAPFFFGQHKAVYPLYKQFQERLLVGFPESRVKGKVKNECRLAQEQHKIQRLENRAAYREKDSDGWLVRPPVPLHVYRHLPYRHQHQAETAGIARYRRLFLGVE